MSCRAAYPVTAGIAPLRGAASLTDTKPAAKANTAAMRTLRKIEFENNMILIPGLTIQPI